MNQSTKAPRTTWEDLARQVARTSGDTRDPEKFVAGLMNLGNEMYHYNIGVMLSADIESPISVETQTSPAFDDLLVHETVLVEDLNNLPVLKIPRAITTVPATKLAQIVDPLSSTSVAQARREWMELRDEAEAKGNRLTLAERMHLVGQTRIYAEELSKHVGEKVEYEETEGLVSFVAAATTGDIRSTTAGAAAAFAAELATDLVPGAGAVTGFLAGYLLSKLQKRGLAKVTKKYRILLLEKQLISPALLEKSSKLIDRIKRRRVPSAIDIDRSIARKVAREMKPFDPAQAQS